MMSGWLEGYLLRLMWQSETMLQTSLQWIMSVLSNLFRTKKLFIKSFRLVTTLLPTLVRNSSLCMHYACWCFAHGNGLCPTCLTDLLQPSSFSIGSQAYDLLLPANTINQVSRQLWSNELSRTLGHMLGTPSATLQNPESPVAFRRAVEKPPL